MRSSGRAIPRWAARHETFLPATIVYGGSQKQRLACFVRDLGYDGAKLELANEYPNEQILPAFLVLDLATKLAAFNARLVWRNNAYVGVSFREAGITIRERVFADAMSG
jgi:hypothetical protein